MSEDKEDIIELPVNYNEIPYNKRWKIREEYIKRQGGRCKYCGEPLDGPPSKEVQNLYIEESLFPKGFLNNPHHLHHNHDTGMTIGTVHARCNAVLWQYHGE